MMDLLILKAIINSSFLDKVMYQDKHGKLSQEEAENRILTSGLQEGKYLKVQEGQFTLEGYY